MLSPNSLIVLLSTCALGVVAKEIDNVFTSLEIGQSSIGGRAQELRNATVAWEIDSAATAAGDTFSLIMPCVFRTVTNEAIALANSDGVYATCDSIDGAFTNTSTQLNCIVTDAISKTKDAVSGSTTFGFTFNVGTSASDVDIKCALTISEGVLRINWLGLEADVTIAPGSYYPGYQTTDEIVYYARTTVDRRAQLYFLSGVCEGGIKSGTMALLTQGSVDCSSFGVYGATSLNAFMMPNRTSDLDKGILCNTNQGLVQFAFRNVDSRAFVSGIVDLSGSSSKNFVTLYNYRLTCNDNSVVQKTLKVTYAIAA